MHTVGPKGSHEVGTVVHRQPRTVGAAERHKLPADLQKLLVGGFFHAQLNPPATAEQGLHGPFQIAETRVVVGDELNGCHSVISFSGAKKWFTGPCPRPTSKAAPVCRACVT